MVCSLGITSLIRTISKRMNRENVGLEWHLILNPTGLYECLIVHTKNVGFFQTGLSGWKNFLQICLFHDSQQEDQ